MKAENYIRMELPSRSANEAVARGVAATFAAQMDPTLEELGDIKTAVSEAVTNCIVHAYPNEIGIIILQCRIIGDMLEITVKDKGRGIDNLEQARPRGSRETGVLQPGFLREASPKRPKRLMKRVLLSFLNL